VNWSLSQDKLVFTTTDNGSNFISAFDLLELPKLSCFEHNLDLAMNKALQVDRIQQVIRRCHALVGLFSRSWKKNQDLRQKQLELRLPEHRLISDVTTRWGSTYSMIARILEQQQAVLADDRKHWHLMPSDREFTTLEIVSQVLQPLPVFTDTLSGEPKLPYHNPSSLILLSVSTSDCMLMKDMKETIYDSLGSCYIQQKVSELIDKCSFLDSSFKTDALPDNASTFAQLKAEAEEIVESPDGAAEPEGAPPPPRRAKGWQQYC